MKPRELKDGKAVGESEGFRMISWFRDFFNDSFATCLISLGCVSICFSRSCFPRNKIMMDVYSNHCSGRTYQRPFRSEPLLQASYNSALERANITSRISA